MKNVLLLSFKMILLSSILLFTACSDRSDNIFEKSSDIYPSVKEFISSRSQLSQIKIADFMKISTSVTKKNTIDDKALNLWIVEKGTTYDELYTFLETNPQEINSLFNAVASPEFNNMVKLSKEISYSDESTFAQMICDNDKLNQIEKTFIMLIMASESNNIDSVQTRSFWSCVKRYAKLTEIAAKSTAMAIIDVESAAEYASRELSRMGAEYDC